MEDHTKTVLVFQKRKHSSVLRNETRHSGSQQPQTESNWLAFKYESVIYRRKTPATML